MASKQDTSSKNSSAALSRSTAIWLVLGALAVAAAPHFFLETPLALYEQQNASAWVGLTIWSPALLAAAALFAGVAPGARVDRPLLASVDLRMAAALSVPIAVLVVLGFANFDGYQHVISWSRLASAMAVYAGVFAVGTFFWQGLLQHRVLGACPRAGRITGVVIAGAAVWLPFLVHQPWEDVGGLLLEHALVYLALGVLFEVGLPVYALTGSAALIGVAYAWVHQMTFF
jgi:hypothetical protein